MQNLTFGIDPGLSGYMAVVDWGGYDPQVDFYPCPTLGTGPKGRNESDPVGMLELIDTKLWEPQYEGRTVYGYLEAITPNATRRSILATFTMGGNYWLWRGLLLISGIPFDLITPQKWHKAVGIPKKSGKDKSLEVAWRNFPNAKVGKNHNKADALLMAWAAKKEAMGE
jgi:hypothetical protein